MDSEGSLLQNHKTNLPRGEKKTEEKATKMWITRWNQEDLFGLNFFNIKNFLISSFLLDKNLLCSPGRPGTYCIDQTILELMCDFPASAFWILGWQVSRGVPSHSAFQGSYLRLVTLKSELATKSQGTSHWLLLRQLCPPKHWEALLKWDKDLYQPREPPEGTGTAAGRSRPSFGLVGGERDLNFLLWKEHQQYKRILWYLRSCLKQTRWKERAQTKGNKDKL